MTVSDIVFVIGLTSVVTTLFIWDYKWRKKNKLPAVRMLISIYAGAILVLYIYVILYFIFY